MCMQRTVRQNQQNDRKPSNQDHFSTLPLNVVDHIFQFLTLEEIIRSSQWSVHFLKNTERYFLNNKKELNFVSVINNKLKISDGDEQDFFGDKQLKWMQVKKFTLGNSDFHENGLGDYGFLKNLRTFVLLDKNVRDACYCISKMENLQNLVLSSNELEEDDIMEMLRLIRFDEQTHFQLVLDQQTKLTPRVVDMFLFVTRKLCSRTIKFTIEKLWQSFDWSYYRDLTYFDGIIHFFESTQDCAKELEQYSSDPTATACIEFDYMDYLTAQKITKSLYKRNPRQTSDYFWFRKNFLVKKPEYGLRTLEVKFYTERELNGHAFRMEEFNSIDDGSREYDKMKHELKYGYENFNFY